MKNNKRRSSEIRFGVVEREFANGAPRRKKLKEQANPRGKNKT